MKPFSQLDRQTFQVFYDETSAPLRRYLLRVCRDPAQAEDVFQESYVRLINRSGLQTGPELRSYLFRVATNLLRDHWRRRARETKGLLNLFGSLRGAAAKQASAETLDLESALAELDPKDCALLWLAHVEGHSHREIAQTFGLKVGSVRVLLFRLRKRLAERLDSGRGVEQGTTAETLMGGSS